MGSNEYILLTGREDSSVLDEALGAALEVRHCPGPSKTECPAVHGEGCPLREEARAVVVFLVGEHELWASGNWQCLTAGRSPAVTVLEGSDRPASTRGTFAVVGGDLGAIGVLQALTAVVDNPEMEAVKAG